VGHEHCTEKSRKNKHLSYRERLLIEVLYKEKKSSLEISERLCRSIRTIQRELHRGRVKQLDGSSWEYYITYSADVAQTAYLSKRGGSGPSLKIGYDHKLCEEIERQIKEKRSPDVIAHDIRTRQDEFEISICTRTIYNYLSKNIFLTVDYKDLIYGHYRKKKRDSFNRPSYKNLKGRSIEDRPAEADNREQVGHWEMDLVLGGKSSTKACLLTLTERCSRREIIRKLPDRTQTSVVQALDIMERQMGRRQFTQTFRTITVDNGVEFLNSSELERSCLSRRKQRTQVFYAHPYSAYERGSNENLNRMIRRFIPKGADIGKYTKREIKRIEMWLNTYPRKILDYRTPLEVYRLVS
jgi:IS30 family transposase